MDGELLFEMIGEIEETWIVQAHADSAHPEKMTWRQWALAAACVMLLAGTVIPVALAAAKGDCPFGGNKCGAPVESDNADSLLPSLTWQENGNGLPPHDSWNVIEFDGTYYEGLNMSDTELLDHFNLPHEIHASDLQDRIGTISTEDGKALTFYGYRPNQQAVYIMECEGKFTFAVFCNRVRENLFLYDTAEELFAIYGIHQAEDIYLVEIGGRKLTEPDDIAAFYKAMCSAQAMGNAEWNRVVFNGMSEKESSRLCTDLADTMQEISVISTSGMKANGLSYYPTIGYVEWAINYYRLEMPLA